MSSNKGRAILATVCSKALSHAQRGPSRGGTEQARISIYPLPRALLAVGSQGFYVLF